MDIVLQNECSLKEFVMQATGGWSLKSRNQVQSIAVASAGLWFLPRSSPRGETE